MDRDHAEGDADTTRDDRTRRWLGDRLTDILGLYDEARENTAAGRQPVAVRL